MKNISNSSIIIGFAIIACLMILAVSCAGCSGVASGLNKITDVFASPSAREIYQREFKDDNPQVEAWKAAYENAKNDSIIISLPYGEKGTFSAGRNLVYSYMFDLKEGEVLVAEVLKDSVGQRVFIDIFELDGSGSRHLESNEKAQNYLSYTPRQAGTYRITVQPEIAANSDFFISVNKKPLYATFPVAGKGNAAIGSFWGMERDGGKRSHEGIDIFAKKGTPVVATTNGLVSYTGERGLGGKQVWLRDASFGASLYYAHLDAINVVDGAQVKVGDTLGFVGNTGNAQFTPPHLHFGIYRSSGAVDPLPFVYATAAVTQKQFARTFKTTSLEVKSKANLRKGPSLKSAVIGTAFANEDIILLGQSEEWLHIQTSGGKKAFINKSLIKA